MANENSSNTITGKIILTDAATGIKYLIAVEDCVLKLIEQGNSAISRSNVIISDSITGIKYSLIIEDCVLKISERDSSEYSSKVILTDAITEIKYLLAVENRILKLIEDDDQDNGMILEFADKSRIQVISIFGGPVNVNGIIRDVLTIEIDPNTITQSKLETIFNNPDKLVHLYTYEPKRNQNGDIFDTRIEIGEGYIILLGIELVTRKVNQFPGKIVPDKFETIYTVSIAQLTYDEWISSEYYK